MTLSDPIADYLTRIRNAKRAKHRYVEVHFSKMKLAITKILGEEGFITHFLVNEEKRVIRIFLKYNKNRESVIHDLKRVSKPSVRKYIPNQEIPRVLGGMGTAIVSTSKGVLSGKTAKKERVGGELLCLVW
ncbi:MAG: 30S ribosomal protein S8 [Simkaniaceae bacterium]